MRAVGRDEGQEVGHRGHGDAPGFGESEEPVERAELAQADLRHPRRLPEGREVGRREDLLAAVSCHRSCQVSISPTSRSWPRSTSFIELSQP